MRFTKKLTKEQKEEMKFLTKYYESYKDHEDEKFLYVTYPNVPENRYVISTYGKVISFENNRVLKIHDDKDGYGRLIIKHKNKMINLAVHRLVAYEYCKKPEGCNVVNHLDCDKHNNYYKNLEWTTVKGNTQHAIANGLTVRAGCNSNGAKYDQRIIEDICQKLESGMDVYQVYNTYYPYDNEKEHHSFYQLIYRLKTDEKYLYPVRNKYNIDTVNISSEKRKWTKDELKKLKKMVKDGMSNKEIRKAYGFDDSYVEGARRISDKLKLIRAELGIENPDITKLDKKKNRIRSFIKDGKSDADIYKFYNVYELKTVDSRRYEIRNLIYPIRKEMGIPDTEIMAVNDAHKNRREKVIELIKSGKTNKEIYKFYGVENLANSDRRKYIIRNQVVDIRKQLEIPDPDKVKHDENQKILSSMIKSGKTNKEIYKFYGVEGLNDTDKQRKHIRTLIYLTRKQLNISNPK